MPTKQSPTRLTGLPDNLNDIFQRVYAFIRSIFGTTVGAIILSAILIIFLIIISILLGV